MLVYVCVCVCVIQNSSDVILLCHLLSSPPSSPSIRSGCFPEKESLFCEQGGSAVVVSVCVFVCVCVCLRPGFTSHLPHLSICCLTLYIKLPIYPKQALTRRESYYASGMQHNTYNIERHHLQNSSVLCLFPSSRLSHRPRKYHRPHFWTFRRAGGEPAGLFIAPDCKTFQGYENTG